METLLAPAAPTAAAQTVAAQTAAARNGAARFPVATRTAQLATAAALTTLPTRTDRAEALLDELMARVGVDGLVAVLESAALADAVEAHEAGILEHLDLLGLDANPNALAGYAAVLLTATLQCGRTLPADPATIDWQHAEWHVLRLLAVCSLAVTAE